MQIRLNEYRAKRERFGKCIARQIERKADAVRQTRRDRLYIVGTSSRSKAALPFIMPMAPS